MLSEDFPTNKLSVFLAEISELKKYDEYYYKNKESFSFVSICLLKATNIDSWFSNDSKSTTNLITIICEKGNHIVFKEIEKVLIQIALFLN